MHQVHRQLTWGWDANKGQWELLQDEVRPYYYDDYSERWLNDEVAQQQEYEYNVGDATHGHQHIDSPAIRWPGPAYNDSRRDAYFVGMMGWSPGMPAWEWQHYQNVWPQGAAHSMSPDESAMLNSATQSLISQGPALPTPEDEEKAARNKNIGVAVGVGLFTTLSLWLILKVASHGA